MMTEEVARAFTVRLMDYHKIAEMRERESLLQPTRCFTASQIAKDFLGSRKVDISEQELSAMNKVWLDFYTKILYPQQIAEDALHPTDCTMMSCKHPWDERCKTKWQEMWQWEDYALQHYKTPAVPGRNLEQAIGLV